MPLVLKSLGVTNPWVGLESNVSHLDLDPSLQTGPIRKAAWTSAWHDSQVPVSAIQRDESWGEKVWPQSPRGPASGDGLRRRFVSGIRAQEPGLLLGRSGKEQGGEGESGRGEMLRAAAASPGGGGGHGAPPPPAAHSQSSALGLVVHPAVPSRPGSPCWSGCLLGGTDFRVSYQPAVPATGSTAEPGIRAAPAAGKYRDFPSAALGHHQASGLLKHASGVGTSLLQEARLEGRPDGLA